jgi:hypothetical protein
MGTSFIVYEVSGCAERIEETVKKIKPRYSE